MTAVPEKKGETGVRSFWTGVRSFCVDDSGRMLLSYNEPEPDHPAVEDDRCPPKP